MKTTPRILLPAGAVLLLGAAQLFGTPQDDELTTQRVGGAVSYLRSGKAGNVGVQVGPDGILMIDDQFARYAPDIEAQLATLAEGAPAYLVNTHWHGDHTGGNAHFGRAATILAHANVRQRLATEEEAEGEPTPPAALPVITYEDGVSIHFNGEEVRLLHIPRAHTDGDTVVWFTGSNVAHLGDLYFQVGYPYVDVGSGGNVFGMIEGVERVLEMLPADVRLISGHGEVTGVEGLREYLAMLRTLTGRVRELQAAGFTLDEMMDAGITEDHDARWSWSFIDGRKFVESVIASLE